MKSLKLSFIEVLLPGGIAKVGLQIYFDGTDAIGVNKEEFVAQKKKKLLIFQRGKLIYTLVEKHSAEI